MVNALLNQASPEQKNFINDCFNKVVTYNLRIKLLSYTALNNGKYKVELEIAAERISDDINQLPDLYIDLACFDPLESDWDAKTRPVYFQKHHLLQNKTMLSIIVNHKPKTIALDPYGYVLDGDRSDNILVVE